MSKILTGQLRTVPGVYYAVAQPSRVISLQVILKFAGDQEFVISEAIANPFRVLVVNVWLIHSTKDTEPDLFFRLTTGVGGEVDYATVYDWPAVVPLRWEGSNVSWPAKWVNDHFSWEMRKPYTGQGRRLGLAARMSGGGVSITHVIASYQIEEG